MSTFLWSPVVILMPVVAFILCYITGDLISLIHKFERGIAIKIIIGFCALLCLFHLLSLPFMYNPWPFTTLYRLYLCLLFVILILYCMYSFSRMRIPLRNDFRKMSRHLSFVAKKSWWQFILWAFVIALVIYQVIQVILHVSYNVDDNFYVSQSVTYLNRNILMSTLPASGMEGSVFPATYILVSWEAFIAFLSKLFNIAPAAFCHSVLPAFLIPMHYMVMYVIGREINKRSSVIFVLFSFILNIVCGPGTYDSGAFLTLRIWQGKAVLVNIFLPLIVFVFMRIIKAKKVSIRNIVFLFGLLLASSAASTVGTYLAPVLYAVHALAFLIIVRKLKEFVKLFIPALLITPFVLWKILILMQAGSLESLSEGTGVNAKSFYEIATRFFGWNLVPIFLIISVIILSIRFKGEKKNPLQFQPLISVVALIVLFINPFTMPYVESYITGVGVYWRVFWLLMANIIVAAGFTRLCYLIKIKAFRITAIVLLSCILFISGNYIFKDEDVFESFDNEYKLQGITITMADKIEEDVRANNKGADNEKIKDILEKQVLLMPKNLSRELRQYKDIALIHYIYLSNNYMEYQTKEQYSRIKGLYNGLYYYYYFTKDYILGEVEYLGIDYVVIPSDTAKALAKNVPEQFEVLCEGSSYTLYKTNIN